MKKSILFGALAMFAIGAMSIQEVNAQNEVKVKKAETTTVKEKQEKPSAVTVTQEPVKKKDDCCADKKLATDKKESKDCCADKKKTEGCCDEKKVAADQKKPADCCADKNGMADGKQLKAEGKKDRKEAVNPNHKKGKKHRVKPAKVEK